MSKKILLFMVAVFGLGTAHAFTPTVNVGETVNDETVADETNPVVQDVYGTTVNGKIGTFGTQNVYVDGVARATTVGVGGVQNVEGTAENTHIVGGIQNLKVGSKILGSKNIVDKDGIQNIEAGADIGDKTNYITINGENAEQIVDGTVNFTRLYKGKQTVNVGGVAFDTYIGGGTQDVFGTIGGGMNISGEGEQILNLGSSIRITEESDKISINGGTQVVYINIDAATSEKIVMNYGTQHIKAGASISGMKIGGITGQTGKMILDGTAENTAIKSGGILVVTDAASKITGTTNTVDNGGAVEFQTSTFLADSGSAMSFNGGTMYLGESIASVTTSSDLLIRGNGNININMRSGNGGTDSDKFTFGNITGDWNINLKYDLTDEAALNQLTSIDIIENQSVDPTLANFALDAGLDIGLYHWDLQETGNIISAVKTNRASAFVQNLTGHAYSIKSFIGKMSGSMYNRVGEMQWMESNRWMPEQETGFWARGIHGRSKDSRMNDATVQATGVELGYDFKLNNNDSNSIYLGFTGYYANGNAEFETAPRNDTDKLKSAGIGVYGMWLNKSGWFADASLRGHYLTQDATTYNTGYANAITFDSAHFATTLDLDFGREFAWNTDKIGMGWFVTPHIGWNMAYISGDDFNTSLGHDGKIESNMSMTASAEILAGPRWKFKNDGNMQVYAKLGYLNEFSNDVRVKIGTFDMSESVEGGQVMVGGGLNYQTEDGETSIYLDATYRYNSDYDELAGVIGIRIQI